MQKRNRLGLAATGGLLVLAILACSVQTQVLPDTGLPQQTQPEVTMPPVDPEIGAIEQAIPTLSAPESTSGEGSVPELNPGSTTLSDMYDRIHPGVVNIQVFIQQNGVSGQGVGSGFIIDEQGHIATNNHVISGADEVIVVFSNGFEAIAEVVGTDDDSDLAVLKVDALPDGTHPLPLGDSDQVRVGEWVVAIGNPFALGSSMTIGIVSATGRAIESGVTPFSIPQAIQTDAAINPGNSGGPLLNLNGVVIGINAQIATGGTSQSNSGVGFAIPSNVARRVLPVLIERGMYAWPYLGITGTDVNLVIANANDLEVQTGAYIDSVVQGSPADQAGIRGSTGTARVGNLQAPIGGDVIIEADGNPVIDLNDLLVRIADHYPGEEMALTILRDGERVQVDVTLVPRPQNFDQ